MKRHLRNIEQRLREILVEPLQKSGSGRTEPMDLWTEIQKRLREQITVGISGVPTFPSRHASIVVGTENDSEKHRLESALNPELLRSAVTEFLAEEEGCRPPAGFWVSVDFVPRTGDVPGLAVNFDNEGLDESKKSATLRVLSGQANAAELKIPSRRINIGRTARVKDEQGHVVRHNELAFADLSNGVNETVSRRHAHIEFDDKSGCYRLFRDSNSAETSVKNHDVPLSGPGVALKSGDIIRLGKAEIEFVS